MVFYIAISILQPFNFLNTNLTQIDPGIKKQHF